MLYLSNYLHFKVETQRFIGRFTLNQEIQFKHILDIYPLLVINSGINLKRNINLKH